jgi:hypothetical protein
MAQLASDSFPTAGPDLGTNWTQDLGSSNGLYVFAPGEVIAKSGFQFCNMIYNAVVFPDDQYSEMTLVESDGPDDFSGPGVRFNLNGSSQGVTGQFSGPLDGTTNCSASIQVWNGAPGASYGPFNMGTCNPGDTFRISVTGSVYSVSHNGTVVGSATDTTYASGQPSLSVFQLSGGQSVISSWAGGTPETGHSISGNAGIANAVVNYSGTSSGSVTADGSGNYEIDGLADGKYTITPSLASYIFTPTSQNVTVSGSDITGVNFAAAETIGWSPVDCRVAVAGYGPGANSPVVFPDGSVHWTGQQSSNSHVPTPTSNPNLPPTDSRASKPENSRVDPSTV